MKHHYKWNDGANTYAKVENGKLVVVEGAPANGLSSYMSHLLGLDPASAASKPLAATVQTADPTKATLAIEGIVPDEEVKSVRYTVKAASTPDAENFQTIESVQDGDRISFGLPEGEERVKFYKVEVDVDVK